MTLLADAIRIAAEIGLDWQALPDVMNAGADRAGTLEKAVGPALQRDFGDSQFTISNAATDLDYAVPLF